MKKNTLMFCFLLVCHISIAQQIADVSFNTNTWTTPTGVTVNSNEMTIIGNPNSNIRAYLDVNVPITTKALYFVAEIQFNNIVSGELDYQVPKLKIFEGGTFSSISGYNISHAPDGEFLQVAMKIDQFNKKNLSQVRLAFNIQNASGTMIIKNPQFLSEPPTASLSFPFNVPSDTSCNLNIISTEFHEFENDLLSSNTHFGFANYSWDDAVVIDLINTHFPMTNMRFPAGAIGNFYDWTNDNFYNNDYTQTRPFLKRKIDEGFIFQYEGYKTLSLASNANSTLMFNVMYDDVTTAKNRLQSRLNDGLDIKWVELGNENYFSGQNLGYANNVSNYISHTKAITTALKEISPTIKVAANINHSNYNAGSWNVLMAAEDYYDALVVHPYINSGTFLLNNLAAYKMMSSYKITNERVEEYNLYNPNIPMICTEWNTLSKGTPTNFVQTLSIADTFLAFERGNEQGIIKQTGIHMLYHTDNYNEQTLAYYHNNSMKLTANGIFYASLFKTFKSGNVFDAYSVSSELEPELPAVNAKAIDQGDNIKVFVVNKLPVSSPLNLTIDGNAYTGNYTLDSYHEDIDKVLTVPYATYEEAWTTQVSNGQINIPAYSIAIVTIAKADTNLGINELNKTKNVKVYPNPFNDYLQIDGVKNINTVEIYTITGKKIQTENHLIKDSDYRINLSKLSAGMYFLKVETEIFKIVKQ